MRQPSAARVEDGPAIQICQHTCPVVDAAAEFPSLCEEETAAMSRALGRHAMRLATLAKGDGVCTTVIPLEAALARGAQGGTSVGLRTDDVRTDSILTRSVTSTDSTHLTRKART